MGIREQRKAEGLSKFGRELSEWTVTGKVPESGDQDLKYYLEIQKKRQEARGLKMEYHFSAAGALAGGGYGVTRTDAKYTNRMDYQSCRREVTVFQGDKCVFSRKEKEIFYEIITDLKDGRVTGAELYCCPTCGAISPIRVLTEGCPYCHTKFRMSDLFPKVTNFFFIKDHGLSNEEAKSGIRKWCLGGGILTGLWGLFLALGGERPGGIWGILSLLLSVAVAALIGAVGGYFALSIRLLVGLFADAAGTIPMLFRVAGAKKRLTNLMKRYDPYFSYDYFSGQVLGLLKVLLYSDDWDSLPVYEGRKDHETFPEIIDAVYRGAMAFNGCRFVGNYCHLDVSIYMQDLYDRGNKIHKKNDVFHLRLCKNMARPPEPGFSIKRVQCRNCGGSFDSTKIRYCPYCKGPYDMKEDDWVVLDIMKV